MRLAWLRISCTVVSLLQLNLACDILMASAIKRVHNLPPHLSYVSTLPDITRQPKSCLSSSQQCEWLWKKPVLVGLKWLWRATVWLDYSRCSKWRPLCLYVCTQPCLPQVNGFVNDDLRNMVTSVNELLLQLVNQFCVMSGSVET